MDDTSADRQGHAGRRIGLVCQRNNNVPFLFEAAASAGHALVLIHAPDEDPPTHLPAVEGTLCLDVFDDPDGAIEGLAERSYDLALDGLVTCREEAIVWTAMAARRLGLPGLDAAAARLTRNKAEMRACFDDAGLNTLRHVRLAPSDPAQLPAGMSYPVVVKPTAGFSSQGVVRADDDASLADAIAKVRAITATGRWGPGALATDGDAADSAMVLIEEFIDGPEYVVEVFAVDGRVHVLSIGYKGDPRGPFFEESVYLAPAPLPPALEEAVITQVVGGMRALGLTDGPGHAELRIDGGTTPHLLEIGARIGGSGVSHFIVENSTGIDFANLQYRQATGLPLPDLPERPEPTGAAGNWIIPLGGHGRFEGIEGLDAVEAHPDTRRVLTFLTPGMTVRPYPEFSGYPGFILSRHAGRHAGWNAGREYHAKLERTVRVRWGDTVTTPQDR